jgi:hypothetical protein
LSKALIAILIVQGACGVESEGVGSVESAATTNNGVSLNGVSLNGVSLNGVSLNGVSLNGVSLNGVSLNGTSLTGELSSGDALELTVVSSQALPAPNDDVWVHDVRYQRTDGTSGSLCPSGAIAVEGIWNYSSGVPGGGSWSPSRDSFTFACRGNAIAKCIELGYKPWKSETLRAHHQACTRMIRADYCGDGTPNTLNGWRLDVFDAIGVQARVQDIDTSRWSFEAKWTASGALCMSSYRALDLLVASDVPSCVAARLTTCEDDGFADGSLVQNYFDPWSINVALQDAYDRYPGARSDLQGAMTLIDQSLALLGGNPARPRDAAQKIEQAITKLESAMNKDLPDYLGFDLMRRYTLLVRSSLEFELEKARARGAKIDTAQKKIGEGDAQMAKRDYHNATKRFKDGIGSL